MSTREKTTDQPKEPAGCELSASAGSVPAWMLNKTFCVEYSPNCVSKWLVRFPGKSAVIDKRQYFFKEGMTGDVLGFGSTLEEAANAARNAQNGQSAGTTPEETA